MINSADITDQSACPTYDQLLAFRTGRDSDCRSDTIGSHLTKCAHCQTRLDEFDDLSDPLIQQLGLGISTPFDEPEFRRLQANLLAHPEPFSGSELPSNLHMSSPLPNVAFDQPLPLRLGTYELTELLGHGATGAVYKGRHLKLHRAAAVKVLFPEHVSEPASVARFFREMKAVGQLDHPNIIRATDAGEESNRHYLVMEYVPGIDVSTLVSQTGTLSVANACEVVRQAAAGLDFAHEHSMVHRDVKPSNLMLTEQGQIKLLDLGLVAFKDEPGEGENERLPRGTADYMSPEQWTDYQGVDIRADIYSLGCTLFKLLCGHTPYRFANREVYPSRMTAHLQAPIPSAKALRPDIPLEVESTILRLLAKDPGHRFDRPRDVAVALRAAAQTADLPGLIQTVRPWSADVSIPAQAWNPATDDSSKPVLVSRRALMATMGIAAIPLGAAVWQFVNSGTPQLKRGQWRSIMPTRPKIVLSDDAQSVAQSRNAKSIEVNAQKLTLVELGMPVVGQFSVRAELQQNTASAAAGIYFRYGIGRAEDDTKVYKFQAIQLVPDADAAMCRLQWSSFLVHQTDHNLNIRRIALANNALAVEVGDNQPHRLEIMVGHDRLPEVHLDGQSVPSWILLKDGYFHINMNKAQVPNAYAGRVGLLTESGKSVFRDAELSYYSP